jgi:hypothetical protein
MATAGDRLSPEKIAERNVTAKSRKISPVLADMDGTLVTEDKVLTKRAQAAVQRLHDVGIRFAITSGRPPRGMTMLFDALQDDEREGSAPDRKGKKRIKVLSFELPGSREYRTGHWYCV